MSFSSRAAKRVLRSKSFPSLEELEGRIFLSAVSGNDDFYNRATITGTSASQNCNNSGASLEDNEPRIASQTGGRSVWWTWTAPVSINIQIDTAGSDFDTLLGVYTGNSVSALTEVACNDDVNDNVTSSVVRFIAIAGTEYQIAVDGYQGAAGNIVLNLSPADRAPDTPTDVSPADGANAGLTPTLTASDFSDQNADDTHAASQWVVRRSSNNAVVFDSGTDTTDKTSCVVPPGILANSTGYYWQVRYKDSSGLWSDYSASASFTTRPVATNDDFANRGVITGLNASRSVDNTLASREVGEPNHAGMTGGHSVWWTWKAPASMMMQIDTAGSDFDTLLGVYTGGSISSLTEVGSNDEAGDLSTSLLVFHADAGTTYQIAVDGYDGAVGTVMLNLSPLEKAPDTPVNSTPENGETVTLSPTLTASDFSDRNAGDTHTASQWVIRRSSNHAVVYDSGEDSNDMTNCVVPPDVLTSSTNYYWQVRYEDSTGLWSEYSASTTFRTAPLAANDNFAGRAVITGSTASRSANNLLASTEPGEPNHGGETGGHSLWWTWRAPSSCKVQIDTAGSDFDTLLGVYTGDDVSGLTEVAGSDDVDDNNVTSVVTFDAQQGTVYQIAVDGYQGDAGNIVLNIFPPDKAPDTPVSGSPSDGHTVGLTPTLTASDFHDANDGDTHAASQWILRRSSDHAVVYDSGEYAAGTSFDVPSGTLAGGTSYYWQVRYEDSTGLWSEYSASATFKTAAELTNDNFAGRTVISGSTASATGSNFDASLEDGEPSHAEDSGGHSVWWTWTAPSSGNLQIDTTGSDFDTLLGVYTGGSVLNLREIGSNDDVDDNTTTSLVSIYVTAGTVCQIAVDGYQGDVGNIVLNITSLDKAPYRPSNSSPLNGARTSLTPTLKSSEFSDANDGDTQCASQWIVRRKSNNAIVYDSGEVAGGQTSIAVPSGKLGSGSYTWQVRYKDPSGLWSEYSTATSFTASATITNDNFIDRYQITGLWASVNGSNVNASTEWSEPNHAGNASSHSVWWTWTAPASGKVQIDTAGSDFDTVLGVYTGDQVSNLTEIASNDEASDNDSTSKVNFDVVAGTVYQIAVDGYDGDTGNIVLNLSGDFTNTAPTLDLPNNEFSINEDAGQQTMPLVVTAGGNESQQLQITASSSNPALIADPTIVYNSPSSVGHLSFIPSANASGDATITVTVRDSGLDGILGNDDDATTEKTFTVSVISVNDAPVADNQSLSTSQNEAIAGSVTGSDAEGSPLTYSMSNNAMHGQATLQPDGSFVYVPEAGYIGPDSFSFTISDGDVDSAAGVVSIEVGRTQALDARGNARYTDANGTIVNVSLRGGGAGLLLFSHDGWCDASNIVLSNTTERSALKIVTGGGQGTSIGGIDTSGCPLGRIVASTTDLTGRVSVGRSANPRATVSMTFDQIANANIETGMPLKSLKASEWINDDAEADVLTAPSVGAILISGKRANPHTGAAAVRGDFQADLNVGTDGDTVMAIGSLSVAGVIDGSTITASVCDNRGVSIGAITAGRVEGETVVADGGVNSLLVSQWQTGSITAGWVGKITTRANAALGGLGHFGASLTLTGSALFDRTATLGKVSIAGDLLSQTKWDIQSGSVGSLTFVGTVDHSLISSAGGIASIKLGASNGSDFGAGVSFDLLESDRHVGVGDALNSPTGTIRSFKVTGWKIAQGEAIPRFFIDSNISAKIGKLSVLNWDSNSWGGLFAPAGGVQSVVHKDTADSSNDWVWPNPPGHVSAGPGDFVHVI